MKIRDNFSATSANQDACRGAGLEWGHRAKARGRTGRPVLIPTASRGWKALQVSAGRGVVRRDRPAMGRRTNGSQKQFSQAEWHALSPRRAWSSTSREAATPIAKSLGVPPFAVAEQILR